MFENTSLRSESTVFTFATTAMTSAHSEVVPCQTSAPGGRSLTKISAPASFATLLAAIWAIWRAAVSLIAGVVPVSRSRRRRSSLERREYALFTYVHAYFDLLTGRTCVAGDCRRMVRPSGAGAFKNQW